MIKEQTRLLRKVLIVCDLCLLTSSFFIGYVLRNRIRDIRSFTLLEQYLYVENLRPLEYYALYLGLLPVFLFMWGSLLYYFGMYNTSRLWSIPESLGSILKAAIVGFIIFGSYVFILRMQEDISRLFIGFIFITAAILLSFEKIVLVLIIRILSKMDMSFKSALVAFRRILIVGTGKRSSDFIELIKNNPGWNIRIVGLLDMDIAKKGVRINGQEVIGTLNDIPHLIQNNVIDEIVFIVPRSWLNKIEDIMLYCENAGLKVHLAVNLFDLKFSRAKQTDLHGFPLLVFENTPEKLEHLFIKRLFDFFVSGFALIILIPVFMIIAIGIKITSEGPVFYKQLRCGLYGRKFMFYKFRTMVKDAESRLKDLLIYNEMSGPVFKMMNDPRVTGIGKWLRKFSLDELPQLWNVLKGDMSLVGPRPPLPHEVENYDNCQRRRLSMRPGITCLWQISGRNKIVDFNEWMKLDLEYIDNWSLWLDVKTLFKTIPVVFSGLGAR